MTSESKKKSVIVKAQMTLDHKMLKDSLLPLLGYCTLSLSETALYEMQNETCYLSDCNNNVTYVTLL